LAKPLIKVTAALASAVWAFCRAPLVVISLVFAWLFAPLVSTKAKAYVDHRINRLGGDLALPPGDQDRIAHVVYSALGGGTGARAAPAFPSGAGSALVSRSSMVIEEVGSNSDDEAEGQRSSAGQTSGTRDILPSAPPAEEGAEGPA
jgi:hypothetical protein